MNSGIIKTTESEETIRNQIQGQAIEKYKIDAVVNSYMEAIEEIININDLIVAFDLVVKSGLLFSVMTEIINQSKVEFNFEEDEL